MIIRQPSATQDRAPIASASVVGAMCLAVGLWLAHAAMGHPAPQASEPEPTSFAGPPSESDDAREGEGEHESEGESEGEHAPAPLPAPAADPPRLPRSGTPSATPPPPPAVTTPRPPPPTGTGIATSVRHGRVAYLRCDGAPQVAGPFPCPRDAALEETAWTAIDGLLTCDPPLPPGQADLVLQFDRTATPELLVTTRDTFPDEAIRTDAAAVVSCIGPALASTTTPMQGELIRVGFRFTLE